MPATPTPTHRRTHHLSPLATFTLLAVAVLTCATAAANVAAPIEQPVLSGDVAVVGSGTPIRVLDEALSITCAGPDDAPSCGFSATYALDNPTDSPQRLTVAFYGLSASAAQASLDGRYLPLERIDTAQAAAAGLPPIEGFMLPSNMEGYADDLSRWQMTLEVAPRAQATLHIEGIITPGRYITHGYSMSANYTRHPWMGGDDPQGQWVMHYLIGPIRTWGGSPPAVRLVVSAPRAWTVWPSAWWASDAPIPGDGPLADFSTTEAGGEVRISSTLNSARVDDLRFDMHLPTATLSNGGLLVGVGGRVDDSGGFRARLGYEVSYPDWLLYGVHLDSDLYSDLTAALMAEAATPSALLFPSLGVGVGPALQVLPEVAAGVRAQVSVHWPVVGFVASFDVFPGLDADDPRMFQATLLGQVGF